MNESIQPQSSPEEVEAARNLLSRLTPGALPLDIFIEVARLTTTPIIEVVPVRRGVNGETEVLLTERDQNDPIWAGMLHTPGTVVRASDNDPNNREAFTRILDGELAGTLTGEPQFVYNFFHEVKRGKEQAQVYFVEVMGDPASGQFCPASNLPRNTVDTQLEFIHKAVEAYENSQQNQN